MSDMKLLLEGVERLAIEELIRANQKFPLFASDHEGYAVALEEFEETQDELEICETAMGDLWDAVKRNNSVTISHNEDRIYEEAIHLAGEAVQFAAMVKKMQESERFRND